MTATPARQHQSPSDELPGGRRVSRGLMVANLRRCINRLISQLVYATCWAHNFLERACRLATN
uniref:Uncharacterized protein n=1 Tax=Oryza sativa subsp. japonica TaxID=39947 RepID=Q6Z687_ORYSJ|nr:hypothetical protein [Oryza sativa Japonica Group]